MDNTTFKQYIMAAGLPLATWDEMTPIPGDRGLEFGISGVLNHNGTELKVLVAVEKNFPESKPGFFLLNAKALPRIPHVDGDGFICYTHDDSVVMDINNPIGIIRECFNQAMKTVMEGLSGRNRNDFLNEYEAYWRQAKGMERLYTNIGVLDKVQLIKYSRLKESKEFFAAGDETDLLASYNKFFNTSVNPVRYTNGIYIPLTAGSDFYIPEPGQEIDLDQLRRFVSECMPKDQEAALTKLMERTKVADLVVFGLAGPGGLRSLFGVYFKNIQHRRHPLLSEGVKTQLIPLTVQRLDAAYLLARGGTGLQFRDKKVLVIGGGSVGSAICDELVKAAITHLTIVDKELLEADNCYRHACGFRYVGQPKAKAIKAKLEEFYPHVSVEAINMSVLDAIRKGKMTLTDYDAVIVATGNATLNQQLAQVFHERIHGVPVFFSWLDPMGIGGHCLVSNLAGPGCYQCLYSNDDLHNIASFASPVQPKAFTKALTGCGSAFVPYGAMDAVQTAVMTVRKVVDALRERITANEVVSWKGSAELFVQEGFRLAARHQVSPEALDESKHLFCQPTCPICGKD